MQRSVAFDDVYDKLIQSFPEVETVVADAAYKTPDIYEKVSQVFPEQPAFRQAETTKLRPCGLFRIKKKKRNRIPCEKCCEQIPLQSIPMRSIIKMYV